MSTEKPEETPRDKRTQTIEALHQDISFANVYRLEVIKTMLAITTALLAFTISFRPTLDLVEQQCSMVIGWGCLSASLIAGIATMYCWERFYISYRDFDWKGLGTDGKSYRKTVTILRRLLFAIQCVGFLVGVAGVANFAIVNVANVHHTS
jgi:hypothetical protein